MKKLILLIIIADLFTLTQKPINQLKRCKVINQQKELVTIQDADGDLFQIDTHFKYNKNDNVYVVFNNNNTKTKKDDKIIFIK